MGSFKLFIHYYTTNLLSECKSLQMATLLTVAVLLIICLVRASEAATRDRTNTTTCAHNNHCEIDGNKGCKEKCSRVQEPGTSRKRCVPKENVDYWEKKRGYTKVTGNMD